MIQFLRRLNRYFIILPSLVIAIVFTLCLTVPPATGQTNEAVYELTLADLDYLTKVIEGPVGSVRYIFSLPANWEPLPGSYVQLNLSYAISAKSEVMPAQMEVRINDQVLHSERLISSTINSLKLEIPADALYLSENKYINGLEIRLNSSDLCQNDQQASLTIESSSLFHFVYRERPLYLDLALYPKPLYYMQAFETTPSWLVLPSQPNLSELQSAAMIAANLGALTRNNLPLETSLGVSTLPITASQQNLVVIGFPERMLLLSQFNLPLPLSQRRLGLRSQMPAAVVSKQPFSYTLVVENSSTTTQSLVVEDRLSPPVPVEACQQCNEVAPGLLRWAVGELAVGQTISTVVQLHPDESLGVGKLIEHTASLLDTDGQVINVDTLTTTTAFEANETMVSSPSKGPYFFALTGQGVPETDGIVQVAASPWSSSHAVVAVTGLNDAAVLLAAHALAAQSTMPGMRGQFAIIQATQTITANENLQTGQDVTLEDLHYSDLVLTGRANETSVNFEIPRGGVLAEQAYLALHFAHGAAFNTISATLELKLNNVPFGSIKLQDENTADNWIKISLPSKRLLPGRNRLTVKPAVDWPDACLNSDALARFWVTIYSDSFMHLPFVRPEGLPVFDLTDYPQFLLTDSGLRDVALTLPAQVTLDETRDMVHLLSFLGSSARGEYFVPQVVRSDQVTPEKWRNYHMIAIGRPTRNPYIMQANDKLPQPFIPGQDEIRQEVDNIIYRLPPGYDLGYIQVLPLPWNENRAMLVGTGTTDTGLNWALNILTNANFNRSLKGNLAVMVGPNDIRMNDTRKQQVLTTQPLSSSLIISKFIPEATVTPIVTPTPVVTATSTPISPVITSSTSLTDTTITDAPIVKPPRYRPPLWTIGLLVLSALILVGVAGVTIWQRHG